MLGWVLLVGRGPKFFLTRNPNYALHGFVLSLQMRSKSEYRRWGLA